MRLVRVILSVVVLAGLFGCSKKRPAAVGPTGPRHVVLQTDWFPQAEHGGFYQALAKGYYQRAGLDVEIRPGGPGVSIKVSVSKGDADFGINPSDDLIVYAARGLPLVMVGAILQHNPQALMVHEASSVKTLKDLNGRTVSANIGMTWIPYLQKELKITFALKPNTFNLASFIADKDAIQQCFVTNEPFFLQERGIKVRTLPVADSGYDSYHTIFCRRALINAEPEVVRAFVAASLEGWRDYLDGDPAPANQLILQRNANMTQGLLDYSRGELILRKLVEGDGAVGERMGQISINRIDKQIDTLLRLKVLDHPVATSDVATKDFLPPAQR